MKIQLYTPPIIIKPMKKQWLKGGLITKEVLSDMYLTQKLSSVDIGKHFGVAPQTVCNKIRNLGIPRRPLAEQLLGQRFGRWRIIKEAGRDKHGSALWLCQCDCGKTGKVTTYPLKAGCSKSCGCLTRDLARKRNGENHPSYKNGKTNKEGYILITDRTHPNANKRGRILEHVYVMSNHLGRPIALGETVHHKNGIRDDNRIENLELRTGQHGQGAKVSDMIKFCVDYLKLYAPQKLAKEESCEFH